MTTKETEAFLDLRSVRPTANRILVMKELDRASHPVSLADLEKSIDTMDRASIFRTLELFAEKDIVHVIEDGSRSLKYELCQSHEGHHTLADQHVHFYCERCKETFCFEEIAVPAILIPEGFAPHSVNYMLKGLCPRCQSQNS